MSVPDVDAINAVVYDAPTKEALQDIRYAIGNALQPLFGECGDKKPGSLPFYLALSVLMTRGPHGITISRAGWPKDKQIGLGWAFGTLRQILVQDDNTKIDDEFILHQQDLVATDWFVIQE